MTYRAVLFDLDGTLLDSVPIILDAASKVFAQMGLPYDEAAVRKSIGTPMAVQARQWAGSRADEFRERYRPIYRALQEERARLFPGTREMLEAVKAMGFLTGIVTSKRTRDARRALEKTGISGFFDVVISADDVERHKPCPDPITKALEGLGVEGREALYVGDSVFDAEAAREAGVEMIGVSWGACSREDLIPLCPMGVVDSWEEFVSRLAALRSSA